LSTLRLAALFMVLALAPAALAQAQADRPAAAAGFIQRLGEAIPGDLAFRDEAGHAVALRDYYGEKPVVLVFAWFGCTTLCPTVTANLAHTLAGAAEPVDGYSVVVASIDPRDSPVDAEHMKRRVLRDDPGQASAWHFITGREASIAALSNAAGFRYAYDVATHQYAHPAGYTLLTPDGRISRYFEGFDFTPAEFHHALDDASRRGVASAPIDSLLLLCFHFAPTGRYSATVMTALRVVAVVLLALAAGVAVWKLRGAARR
jgi:protein SCO1/2